MTIDHNQWGAFLVLKNVDMDNKNRILIISGGNLETDWALGWIRDNKFNKVMAADSGAVNALECAVVIDVFFGDMDSVSEEYINANKKSIKEVIKLNKEKDNTDTDHALMNAIEEKPDEIVLIGATGERMDHVLTTVFSMEKALKAGIKCYLYDRYNKIYITESEVVIRKEEQYGDYVSLVPLDRSVTLSLEGFKYDLTRETVNRGSTLLQSNEIIKDVATIDIHDGRVIVFESRDKNGN